MNSHQIAYEGSDEEIRCKITTYLTSLLLCVQNISKCTEGSPKKTDYISDYGNLFCKAWQNSANYTYWYSNIDKDFPENATPAHPFHGAYGQLSSQFASKISEFGKNMTQQAKALTSVGSYMKKLGKSFVNEEEEKPKPPDEFEVVDLNE